MGAVAPCAGRAGEAATQGAACMGIPPGAAGLTAEAHHPAVPRAPEDFIADVKAWHGSLFRSDRAGVAVPSGQILHPQSRRRVTWLGSRQRSLPPPASPFVTLHPAPGFSSPKPCLQRGSRGGEASTGGSVISLERFLELVVGRLPAACCHAARCPGQRAYHCIAAGAPSGGKGRGRQMLRTRRESFQGTPRQALWPCCGRGPGVRDSPSPCGAHVCGD